MPSAVSVGRTVLDDATYRFVELTGHMAAIGALSDVDAILAGQSGTVITPSATRATG